MLVLVRVHDDDDENAEAATVIISSIEDTPSSSYYEIRGSHNRSVPLLILEQKLIALSSDEEDNKEREATLLTTTWSASSPGSVRNPKTPPDLTRSLEVVIPPTAFKPSPNSPLSPQSLQEVSVKTTSNWKKALSLGGRMKSPKSPHSGELEGWWEDPTDPLPILKKCAPVMLDLWKDPNIKQQLRSEENSGLSMPLIIVYSTSARRP